MPSTTANGIQIEYATFGNRQDPALLLVMGLGAQMTAWDDGLCNRLASHGLWVIKFDNRDVGLSTHLRDAPVPSMGALVAAMAEGAAPDVPYTLHDMGADGFGLLDALGVERAHLCGASLGGMIVQTMDAARLREHAARDYDRAFDPAGVARQMAAAVAATGTRRERLGGLDVPTLVIHGADDPLVPLACGEDTAAAIPNAELLVIDGMGHDLPPALHQRIADAIARHALSHGER